MRTPRFLGREGQTNYFHVISRVVDRRLAFGAVEKEYFRKLLRRQLEFSGLQAIAWCFMGNHFHLLLEVPDKEESLAGWGEDDYLKRLEVLASERYTREVLEKVAMWKRKGDGDAEAAAKVAKVAESVRERLFDLPVFVKEFKQKMTTWINRREGRVGTLWETRFVSVLLEDGEAVRTVAGYIDLNPVRAGLCRRPEEYRWCSYGAAVGGEVESRKGLARAFGRTRWSGKVASAYRLMLFGAGQGHGQVVTVGGARVGGGGGGVGSTPDGYEAGEVKGRGGFTPEQVEEAERRGGKLTLPEALRCRVRYFSAGAAIGSREFVEAVFEEHRERFGASRKSGARKMRGAEWGGLASLRDLGEALQ